MNQSIMLPLKPSTHRKCFIDLKIRENSYPTAASLARDYRAKYGKKVDPRTIANDIADMRKELSAPIHYDSEKRGYVYTNSSFKANIFADGTADIPLGSLGISGLSALGLDQELLPLIPSSAFLSEWHRNLLQTLAEKAAPAGRDKGPGLGKVTVVHREKTPPFPAPGAENAVLEALGHNRELCIMYAGSGGPVREYRLRPCQLVYLKNEETGNLDCFVLGEVIQGGDAPYALLNAAGIQKAGLLEGTFRAAKAVHVHQADDRGIEFLLVNEKNDTLLLFAPANSPADKDTCYTDFILLSRMDIYTGECNTLPPII
jgi:hypothetical protein